MFDNRVINTFLKVRIEYKKNKFFKIMFLLCIVVLNQSAVLRKTLNLKAVNIIKAKHTL